MQRKTLLVALTIVAIAASATLYLLLQPKAPSQPAQNAVQPQPKPPTIMARVEATQGGRVLANGTATTAWSSTKPFTLTFEAL
ncbi:MAG: hypothetical protein ACO2OQ_03240, partial [Thermofilaceae archaeon]